MKTNKTKEYRNRIIETKLQEQLDAFGAVLLRGPKWCGKTTTAEHFSHSAIYLDDVSNEEQFNLISKNDPNYFLEGENPRLIDEWQTYPAVWDAARRYIDRNPQKSSLFIFTGSFSPKEGKTKHTGSMRISTLDMETMSLSESGESSNQISFIDLFDTSTKINGISKLNRDGITNVIVRGGWPVAVIRKNKDNSIYGKQALDSLCSTEFNEAVGMNINPLAVRTLIKSLARNISTPVSNKTILSDIRDSGHPISDSTFYIYMGALSRLFVIREVPAWNPNIRSSTSIRSLPKKVFYETSLACAALNLGNESLAKDFKTRGVLFESLCGRDLSVYASKYGGTLNYYRDRFGLECDYVVFLPDGRYGLFECKCGSGFIEEGAKHLNKLEENIKNYIADNPNTIMQAPSCKVVLTDTEFAIKREDNVIVLPLACLKD